MKFEYAPGATPIDLNEAAGIIPAHLTLQRELNEYEEANILEATEWLFARRRGDPLDERFIHLVHRRMFNQTWKWAGKPRRSDKNIGVSWYEIPVRLRQTLGDVRAQIEHAAYSSHEIAARFHHRLVATPDSSDCAVGWLSRGDPPKATPDATAKMITRDNEFFT